MTQENAILLYKWIIGIFGVGAGAIFLKSKRMKQSEEDNMIADAASKMVNVIHSVNQPLLEEISRLRESSEKNQKESDEKYVQLSIKVGILEKELEIKDKRIHSLESENTQLRLENSELKDKLNAHYKA